MGELHTDVVVKQGLGSSTSMLRGQERTLIMIPSSLYFLSASEKEILQEMLACFSFFSNGYQEMVVSCL